MLLVPAHPPTTHSPINFRVDRGRHLAARGTAGAGSNTGAKAKSALQAEERARILDWVEWLRVRTGQSLSEMAEGAGLSNNTLTRLRQRESALLDALSVRMLCEYTGLPGPDLYKLGHTSGFTEEAEPYDVTASSDPATTAFVKLMLKDRPDAASWLLKTRALEGLGYMQGDIVITDARILPRAGDAVCAQVYDLRTGTAETVFRVYEPPYLIAHSADPALRKPLLIDNERVIVMGAVTESFRTRR
jgi:transcriptional regulator with XRE-family HTH domain